ncbi:bifunctional DNA primase/polymerase [Brevibacterium casei]|uniref:Primase C terminal 1 (PriCT-1) n=2 Tax=Brevibacterium casei TaxID=33889 RepID=A0A2H1K4I3_9MICO|nr:bifunctional DNA primase/polymerase [Brevibacterium casei]MCT1549009.1 bifunctional DNA primase/polymerase [Brevibacterium casei]MCT1558924.1 bifunctional DNA primase/polymerase [Brevibacterium casei]MCT2207219.1 bifunctional DNA primase/polymerase [Brevibacterium casei]QPR38078.1 bifunctional DNA primase/polymerase [Brevibacterium casei]QPR45367.1 bifunctional DNA primase/polymerase [Brevibacterium casei]
MVAPDVLTGVLAQVSDARPLSVAARQFADAGVPVFPCVPGGKRPLTEHGFHDATTDLDQIAAWWRQHPEANIAVPTGAASGVVVVDIDVHGPVNGFDAFRRAQEASLVDGWQLLVSTPSGGMHAYYPATPGTEQRSWQAARAGVDFRGEGGYIITPPSTINSGERGCVSYRVRRMHTGRAAGLVSVRLRDFLDPHPSPAPRPAGQQMDISAERLAAWVAGRPEGERNSGLFWAACRLAENNTPPAYAYAALGPAAEHAGLTMREVSATIRSAYRITQPAPRSSAGHPSEEPRRVPEHAAGRVLS